MLLVSVDKLRVYLMKVDKTFEGTIHEVSAQTGNQISSNLMSLFKEKTYETDDN